MSKKAQNPQFLTLLTWKCASRHSSVHFFDIATSKSGPSMVCFVHFDLEMCFAPQRRALFRHRNFQKWSEPWCFVHFDLEMCFAPQRRALFRHRNFQKWSDNGVFCTFWLGNVLRATTACNFSSLIWPARSARRFSEPTFRPSGATNHWKNTVFRDVPTFSRTCIFFLLSFSLLTLLTSAFQLSILSEVSLLNFLRQMFCLSLPLASLYFLSQRFKSQINAWKRRRLWNRWASHWESLAVCQPSISIAWFCKRKGMSGERF